MTPSPLKRITPRPVREERAHREIGETEFAPGVRSLLIGSFLLLLLTVPLAQFLVPDAVFSRLSGIAPAPAPEAFTGHKISATVTAVSAPPDKNGVYNDFLIQLHLTNLAGMDAGEMVLVVMGMKQRVILPAAGIKPGDRIRASIRAWPEVEARLSSINGSSLEADRFLVMEPWFAEAVQVEGRSGLPSGTAFLSAWKGIGDEMSRAWKGGGSLKDRFLDANGALARRIKLYETELDDASVLALALRPPVQAVLTRLGVGNEKAYVGRDNWLFYEPGVTALTGPAFLDPGQLRKRVRTSDPLRDPVQPDPRPAILDFHRQLKARGIELVLMPTPAKPSVHPESFGRGTGLIRNRSFEAFVSELSAAGVRVYDPAPVLMARKPQGPQYLKSDTHWTPGAMQAVAADLAVHINPQLPPVPDPGWRKTAVPITQAGDIAAMLNLPGRARKRFVETATVQAVQRPDGSGWQPDPHADVLLLGDSFSNIYSLGSMGWGAGGGFAEQLSYALKRPVDRISRNDAGAHASRRMLAAALQRDPARLQGKRVVIWQFAERELAVGDWQILAPPPGPTVEAGTDPAPVPESVPGPTGPVTDVAAAFSKLADADVPAMAGQEDWLFLTAELRHLGRAPFWGEQAASPDADPLQAITDLHTKCAELGIHLILCPAPPRAAVYPDKIIAGAPAGIRVDETLQAFYAALREKGVTVIDVTDAFLEARKQDAEQGPVCCEQDSHWSPRGLQLAAEAVAAAIKQAPGLRDVARGRFTVQAPESLVYFGDLTERVEGHAGTESRTTVVRVTEDEAGETPLRFDPDSPVLLLADSHGLVFSTGNDMHSTAAGFGEALSAELGFAIDCIARRGSGDLIRRDLARRFLQKPEDAAKKKVLIYTFAARTLTENNNWKPVPLKR